MFPIFCEIGQQGARVFPTKLSCKGRAGGVFSFADLMNNSPEATSTPALEAFVGTSGFSYAEWKGSFYPEKLANAKMLAFYGQRLPSVEINNTFYRLPRPSVLEGWANQTPQSFRFSVKAPRRITHFNKLKETGELVRLLLAATASLGVRRGPILFQLPPTMKADAQLLGDFLAEVRAIEESQESQQQERMGVLLVAFEFRHPSWFSESIYQVLREGGAALVSGDLDESEKAPPLIATASHAYLRLRKTEYAPGEIEAWGEKIRGLGVKAVYAYFKHEVLGPKLAGQLGALLR
jgi:uncharacterized protein YecE (DUF72 family)